MTHPRHGMLRRTFLSFAACTPFAAMAANSSSGKWELLGTRNVSFAREIDIVPVGLKRGLFSALRIEASGNAVLIDRLTVIFTNSERETLPVRAVIGSGQRSRDIALPGALRAIRHIEVIYRRAKAGDRATLAFHGYRVR